MTITKFQKDRDEQRRGPSKIRVLVTQNLFMSMQPRRALSSLSCKPFLGANDTIGGTNSICTRIWFINHWNKLRNFSIRGPPAQKMPTIASIDSTEARLAKRTTNRHKPMKRFEKNASSGKTCSFAYCMSTSDAGSRTLPNHWPGWAI